MWQVKNVAKNRGRLFLPHNILNFAESGLLCVPIIATQIFQQQLIMVAMAAKIIYFLTTGNEAFYVAEYAKTVARRGAV